VNAFDLQINGYAGIDFNSACTVEDLEQVCELLREDQVAGMLATIITADIPVMVERIAQLTNAIEKSEPVRRMIAGIHIEGPFINSEPGYVGAHDVSFVTSASLESAKRLVDASGGLTRLFTLAPEQDPDCHVVRWLVDQGIVVAAGHTNASLDELKSAIDNGLSMFTHLGNGCPMNLHRHNNIIQRALSFSAQLWCCYIADGVHVDFFALKNYLRCAGIEKSIIVTDAISAARLGPGTYRLSDWEIEVGDDLIAMAPGGDHFVGSTMTMPRTIKNLRTIGLSNSDIETLVALNPIKALGLN
jgi:N-acetylglucosamine-6-phosphate deacetylase